jgi:hypothetical protein
MLINNQHLKNEQLMQNIIYSLYKYETLPFILNIQFI